LREYLSRGQLRIVQCNFAQAGEVPDIAAERFDGILLDLGVSSHQLDDEARGFTFRRGAALDMRMGTDATISAADVLNLASLDELTRVFREYGDEPRARRLASEVVRRRETRPFATSDDLVGAVRAALGPRSGPSDFARIFQAIRIEVNHELAALQSALPVLRDLLVPGGTLAVISYHSGEDRMVKRAFQEWSRDCVCPPRQPVCTCEHRALGSLRIRKAVVATPDESAVNPRARSARLRAWQSAA
jgi:16S rRNA (cytosine1402-N4)-methyltransferase